MENRKVLIIGDTGMLGQAILAELRSRGYPVIGASRSSDDYKLDLKNEESVRTCFDSIQPELVINCAAIVSVDGCEQNPEEAYMINGRIPGILSELCKKGGSYYIQISTDHFFTGDRDKSHDENCPVHIVNEYARTKYIGECLSLTYDNCLVLRTNVVGFRGKGPDTFIEWIIRCMKEETTMTLYNDFYTSSINSVDFARILADLIESHPVGLLNLASSEVVNKKTFIMELVKEISGHYPDYKEESIHDVSRTRRADSIGLDTSHVEKILGYKMPTFHETINSIANDYRRT